MASEGKGDKAPKAASKAGAGSAPPPKRAKDEERTRGLDRNVKETEAAGVPPKGDADPSEEEDARDGDDQGPVDAPQKSERPKATKAGTKAPPKDAAGGEDREAKGLKKSKSKPRPKPKVDGDLKRALALRRAKDAARPGFHRQEWFRYQRLGTKWRYPQGIQSKMRRHWGTHADVVSIGYRGPRAARGLHPSGFREVLVHNADGLKAIDPAREAVRISGSVGKRKRELIQKAALKRGIRVLNWRRYDE